MEVVTLILGTMLASQPCSHDFWVLTFLHLISFLSKMFFLLLFPLFLFFSQWCEYVFVDCGNTGVSYVSYKIIQSYMHIHLLFMN